MRKSRKILALMMSVTVVGGLFTGCGSKEETTNKVNEGKAQESVTIEDLVTATKDKLQDKKSGSFVVELGAGISWIQDGVSMDITANANLNAEADEDTTYADGKLTINMSMPDELMEGISEDDLNKVIEFKSYSQDKDDKVLTYDYDYDDEVWNVREDDADADAEEDTEDTSDAIQDILDSDLIKKLELTTSDNEYKVSGDITLSDVLELAKETGVDTDEADTLGLDLDAIGDTTFNVSFVFGSDKVLKTFEVSVGKDTEIENEGLVLSIDTLTIKLTLNKIGDVTVEVPSEVVDSAETETSYNYDEELPMNDFIN